MAKPTPGARRGLLDHHQLREVAPWTAFSLLPSPPLSLDVYLTPRLMPFLMADPTIYYVDGTWIPLDAGDQVITFSLPDYWLKMNTEASDAHFSKSS